MIAGGALYILDQLSKWMAIRSIPSGESIAVIPNFFSLVQVHNAGAAFGILPGNNVVFVVLSIFALVSLVGIAKLGLLRRGTLVAAATLRCRHSRQPDKPTAPRACHRFAAF